MWAHSKQVTWGTPTSTKLTLKYHSVQQVKKHFYSYSSIRNHSFSVKEGKKECSKYSSNQERNQKWAFSLSLSGTSRRVCASDIHNFRLCGSRGADAQRGTLPAVDTVRKPLNLKQRCHLITCRFCVNWPTATEKKFSYCQEELILMAVRW